jgi:hypothetical protein
MESVKYEGVYPCKDNNPINRSKIIHYFKENFFLICSFESWSGWKKRKEK